MLFIPSRDEKGDIISTFDTYQEHYTAKHTLIVPIRNLRSIIT